MKNPNSAPQEQTFALESLRERVGVSRHLGHKAVGSEMVTVYNGLEQTGYTFDMSQVEKPTEDSVQVRLGGKVLDIHGLPGENHMVIHDASDPDKAPVIKVVNSETTADKPLLKIVQNDVTQPNEFDQAWAVVEERERAA